MDRLELPMVLPFPDQQLSVQLQAFWENQKTDIENLEEMKNHSLPLARIKKIMKSDEEVRMIAGEVPVLFSRACEMFILEMTMRAWSNTERHRRRTLQKCDVAAAVAQTDIFDFLVDIVPRDDVKEEEAPAEAPVSYCFLPGQPGVTLVDNGWEVEESGSKSDGE
ncbi:uncharacterized protein A4U43_C06F1190 [Asparagus officinalis]|uniref:Transcription factor CBF/NF-Y/archaeal histone domain-containing protein n=1 Tax=Asparagus officinalis TaxID=4686 RepID=A0A5P1ELY5_ASPOF|nr:nuclear transcription factor Y subunit C-3-like [Asparagus officinalis]ONK65809.1 uncharacterized protein A4U43_C06F1190 [Asparagus officinalis]